MDLLKVFWGCWGRRSKDKESLDSEEALKWKGVSEEFTEELQEKWKKRDFGYEEAKEWIENGFKPSNYDLVFYLKKEGCRPRPNDSSLEKLIKEVSWQNIRPDFNCMHRRKWEDSGMDYEETKKWVELGFKP